MQRGSSRTTRALVGFASLLVCVLGISSVVGERGLLEVRSLSEREAKVRAKAEAAEAEAAQRREEVRRLREDDAYLERVARESQGLVRDGETIYRFPED